jgi:hypothetical protein
VSGPQDEHTSESDYTTEHGPVGRTWFGIGLWPTCSCGFAPRDNVAPTEHWRDHGVKVVDEHGRLARTAVQ